MEVSFDNIRQAEGMAEAVLPLKALIEKQVNLSQQVDGEKQYVLTLNKVMRISLIASLSLSEKRSIEDLGSIVMSKSSQRIMASFFTKDNKKSLFSALLKLRYKNCDVDWTNASMVGRIVAKEMYRGVAYLMDEDNLNSFFLAEHSRRSTGGHTIPALELLIGEYGEDMEATLNINGRSVSNAQILIAGATGSGKTNLLAVLIQQLRNLSTETPYPVNFLLFDYKGEFSDPMNAHWLAYFDTDKSCLLDPVKEPLPFSPFRDLTGRTITEINLYSTEMASALCAIERTSISANMNNRLSEAIVNAYKQTQGKPITFELMLSQYQGLMQNPEKDDSVTSVLKQLVRNRLFATEDKVSLVDECFIIKIPQFGIRNSSQKSW